MKIADRNRLISPPGTSKMRVIANELKEAGVDVINFAAGELDVDTSETVKAAAKAAIDGHRNIYTPTFGLPSLRKHISKLVSEQSGVDYKANEVGLTAGAKQALYNAAMVLLNPGDEVIIPQPYWVTFPTQVELAGAKPVFIDTKSRDYRLLAEDVEKSLSEKTKAIIINSPNNPTGVVYDSSELVKIAKLSEEHKFWVIFDECYAALVRDGITHKNLVSLYPGGKERTVLVNSFSKSHALTGWRLGYVAAPASVISAMENLQGHTTSNPNSVSQYAIQSALEKGDTEFIDDINKILQERLEAGLKIVSEMDGVTCAPAEGAFYLFLDVSSKIGKKYLGQVISDVDKLCELALSAANVAVVSGAAFGDPSSIRLSYAIDPADMVDGLKRLKKFFSDI